MSVLWGATRSLTIDHVIPRSKGGEDTWDNLVVACASCNVKKGDKLLEQTNMKLARKPLRHIIKYNFHYLAIKCLNGKSFYLFDKMKGIKIVKNFITEDEVKILNKWTSDHYKEPYFLDPKMNFDNHQTRFTTRHAHLRTEDYCNYKIKYPKETMTYKKD